MQAPVARVIGQKEADSLSSNQFGAGGTREALKNPTAREIKDRQDRARMDDVNASTRGSQVTVSDVRGWSNGRP